jgi:hypothetical protein
MSGRAAAALAAWSVVILSVAQAADNKKPAAPAPAAHAAAPAARPAAPAAGAAHGPSAGAAATSHGPTTGGGASQGVTTSSASHGVTTSSAAHGVTTSSAAHGVTTTGTAGHATTPAAPAGANRTAVGGGVRPGGAGTAAQHPTAFANHPAAAGTHELQAKNGAAVRTRADGSRSDVHDPQRGMDIHHGLNGNRRTVVERRDGTRVVAERGGRGYVQHPYNFHGHEFGHRTFYEHGRAYDRFYGRYPYRGGYLDVYAPARFYPYGFYGYAYAPWAAPVPYAWGWGGAPWYGYYGAFYAPYPVYPAPAFWLADFVIAASLQAAFVAVGTADLSPVPSSPPSLLEASRWVADLLVQPVEADASPALTPEVKQSVADEIKALVQQEGDEAKANAANQDVDPGKNSVAQLLADNQPHVFVAGTDLDLVTVGSSQECAISQGDVLKVMSAPSPSADNANAVVLASKLGTKGYSKECASASNVTVAITDLQDMHNHMREQVDDGLTELQSKQGKGGLPAAPPGAAGPATKAAFAAGAPPPDATAADEIKKQSSEADQAENEAVASVAAGSAGDAGTSTTIAVGQSIDTVTGALGNPTKIIDMGAVKKYVYPDMKITFKNGRVADVE